MEFYYCTTCEYKHIGMIVIMFTPSGAVQKINVLAPSALRLTRALDCLGVDVVIFRLFPSVKSNIVGIASAFSSSFLYPHSCANAGSIVNWFDVKWFWHNLEYIDGWNPSLFMFCTQTFLIFTSLGKRNMDTPCPDWMVQLNAAHWTILIHKAAQNLEAMPPTRACF